MICRHCGAAIPDDQMVCPRCGAEVQIVPDYNPLDDVLAREVKGSVEGATRQIQTDDIRRYRRGGRDQNVNATRVLSQDEAVAAMPTWMYLLFVGSLAMGGALTNTGAGQIIGDAVAAAADTMNNPFLIYLMFFLIPFLMTQVMQNRGVMLIFIPIAIQACKSMGANPVGVIICVQAACLTAFMTPMTTAAVPYYMAAGGYDLKSVVKQSILPAILFCAVSVVWSAIAFPLY